MILNRKIRAFSDRLNFLICLNLIKTRKNPSIAFKIELTEYATQFLTNNYQINGRFKKCSSIFSDLGLEWENFYNEQDFHQIQKDTFVMRIMRKKPLEITKRDKTKKKIFASAFLSVRFLRLNQVELSESDKNNLLSIRHS